MFLQVSDPIGSGFVTNLVRPTGNVTGFDNRSGTARTSDFRIAVTKLVLETIRSGAKPNNSAATARMRLGSSAGYR